MHCKNESVYCALNCPDTHIKNKNMSRKWYAVNTYSVYSSYGTEKIMAVNGPSLRVQPEDKAVHS